MRLALWTLEGWANHDNWVWPESALEQSKRNTIEVITALRQALETEQEPVADKGYYCVVCGKYIEAVDGVIVHDDIPHPPYMAFDEEENPQ